MSFFVENGMISQRKLKLTHSGHLDVKLTLRSLCSHKQQNYSPVAGTYQAHTRTPCINQMHHPQLTWLPYSSSLRVSQWSISRCRTTTFWGSSRIKASMFATVTSRRRWVASFEKKAQCGVTMTFGCCSKIWLASNVSMLFF